MGGGNFYFKKRKNLILYEKLKRKILIKSIIVGKAEPKSDRLFIQKRILFLQHSKFS